MILHHPLLDYFLAKRIVAVIRVNDPATLPDMVDAIVEGGITLIEITLTTPGGLGLIALFADDQRLVVGAGSVLDPSTARDVVDAGARFVASPIFDAAVSDAARSAATGDPIVVMPGAFTPTEIHRAWSYGSEIVKLFPMPPNGVEYVRSLLGPLPEVRLAPSGGVNASTAPNFLRSGAAVLNVGGWLTHEADGTVSPPRMINDRARELVASVADV